MKKFLTSLGASFAIATAAFAGPLNTHGIPADVIGLFHADIEAVTKHPTGEALRELAQKSFLQQEGKFYTEFRDKIGFDHLTDIYDVTIGIMPPREKTKKQAGGADTDKRNPKFPDGVVFIVRGKFNQTKIQAFLDEKFKEPGSSEKTFLIGKHLFYDGFFQGIVSILDDRTILYVAAGNWPDSKAERSEARKAIAKAALAALSGETKSFVVPAPLVGLGKQTGNPIAFFYFNLVSLGIPKPDQKNVQGTPPDQFFLTLGDTDGTLKLRGTGDYRSEPETQQILATAQMGMGGAQIGLAQEIKRLKDDESHKLDYVIALEAGKILSLLKVTSTGHFFNASLDYPAADATKLIKDILAFKAEAEAKAKAKAREKAVAVLQAEIDKLAAEEGDADAPATPAVGK